MLAIGFVVMLAGYSATYVGVSRLRGDKRTVTNIWMGRGSLQGSDFSNKVALAQGLTGGTGYFDPASGGIVYKTPQQIQAEQAQSSAATNSVLGTAMPQWFGGNNPQ